MVLIKKCVEEELDFRIKREEEIGIGKDILKVGNGGEIEKIKIVKLR